MDEHLRSMVYRMRKLPKTARDQVSKLSLARVARDETTQTVSEEDEQSPDDAETARRSSIDVVRHGRAWGLMGGPEHVDRHFPTLSAALDLALDVGERTDRRVVVHVTGTDPTDPAGPERRAVHTVPSGRGWGLRLGDSGLPGRLFADRSAALREAKDWGVSEYRRIVVHPPDED